MMNQENILLMREYIYTLLIRQERILLALWWSDKAKTYKPAYQHKGKNIKNFKMNGDNGFFCATGN